MITIPKPCHESWDTMTPKEKGRLCDKCCKVVVDFTSKTTTQIVDFLKANSGQRTCGRFRAEQVAIPVVQQKRFTRHRLFLAALVFVFGSFLFTSCDNSWGRNAVNRLLTDRDTPQEHYVMGTTVAPVMQTDTTKEKTFPRPEKISTGKKPACKRSVTEKAVTDSAAGEPFLMGDVEVMPEVDPDTTTPGQPELKLGEVQYIPGDTTQQQ